MARRLSATSIPKYLNIIRIVSLECGFKNPLQDNWRLKTLLTGIKRIKGTSVVQKLPITPDILLSIRARLDLAQTTDTVFWAICLVLFFGLLRKGNAMASSLDGFDESRHLRRCDFQAHSWGLEVCIRWSKTIQFKERTLSIPLPIIPKHQLCPAAAVVRAFSVTKGASPTGPAFVVPINKKYVPFTYPSFLSKLRLILKNVGLPVTEYAGHSFRRGGASWALEAGLPGEIIQMLGDWRSDAYRQYLVVPLLSKVRCLHQFSRNLPSRESVP